MEEQLISFETAKLAKNKGCIGLNQTTNYVPMYVEDDSNLGTFELMECQGEDDERGNYYLAITQSLLQGWLREVHNIHIIIHYDYSIIGGYIVTNIIKSIEPRFINKVNKKSKYENYKTYERALEIGLQKSLKLIQ